MKIKDYRKRKGTALVYVLILMIISTMILLELIQFILSRIEYGESREEREQALVLAEAGVDFYRWYLTHKIVEYPSAKLFREFWDTGDPYGVAVPYEREYMGVGRYSISVTPPDENSSLVLVESSGWTYKEPSHKRNLSVALIRPSWGDYIVLCNDTEDHIRFGSGTDAFGLIHSNGGINFNGLAHSLVTSSLYSYNDPDHAGDDEFAVHTHVFPIDPDDPIPPDVPPSRLDVFEAGRELEVMNIDFGKILRDFGYMKEIAGCDYANCENNEHLDRRAEGYEGIYFNRQWKGRHIALKDDGTFDVWKVNGASVSHNGITNETYLDNYTIPQDGIIFIENNAWVDGTVNDNRVTIVAADLVAPGAKKDIYLGIGNISYTLDDGSDAVALLAQEDIEVIKWSEDNLSIDAALLAYNGRVGRNHYGGLQRSSIIIHGCIITNGRYGFAYSDGAGYQSVNLIYDENLSSFPPPYFPSQDKYVVGSWREI